MDQGVRGWRNAEARAQKTCPRHPGITVPKSLERRFLNLKQSNTSWGTRRVKHSRPAVTGPPSARDMATTHADGWRET